MKRNEQGESQRSERTRRSRLVSAPHCNWVCNTAKPMLYTSILGLEALSKDIKARNRQYKISRRPENALEAPAVHLGLLHPTSSLLVSATATTFLKVPWQLTIRLCDPGQGPKRTLCSSGRTVALLTDSALLPALILLPQPYQ